MARAKQSPKQKSGLSNRVIKTLREGALWVFAACALILWFALFTYEPSDPSFSHTSSSVEIQNAIGKFGALLFLFE